MIYIYKKHQENKVKDKKNIKNKIIFLIKIVTSNIQRCKRMYDLLNAIIIIMKKSNYCLIKIIVI